VETIASRVEIFRRFLGTLWIGGQMLGGGGGPFVWVGERGVVSEARVSLPNWSPEMEPLMLGRPEARPR